LKVQTPIARSFNSLPSVEHIVGVEDETASARDGTLNSKYVLGR
jgi:hypothetical protein